MAQRIKGQETELLISVDGAPQLALTDIKTFEVTFKLEKKREGYAGEKTDRYDEVFDGVDGRVELHLEDPKALDFVETIVDRARRRTPGTRVTLKSTLNFPSGKRKLIVIPDPFFGDMPFGMHGRTEYDTLGLDFSASDFNLLDV